MILLWSLVIVPGVFAILGGAAISGQGKDTVLAGRQPGYVDCVVVTRV